MKDAQAGFTIIELMIATAIFSIMLILTTTTIIGVSQTYIKGSVEGQAQQTARAVLSDVSQAIEFNKNSSITPAANFTGDEYYFCIGSDVYEYQLDKYLTPTPPPLPLNEYSTWVLVRYPYNSCQPLANPLNQNGAEELLATNERLGGLNISQTQINGQTAYAINVEVGYGNNVLLNDLQLNNMPNAPANYANGSTPPPVSYQYKYQCLSGLDSSFCATSSLTTTVTPRIND